VTSLGITFSEYGSAVQYLTNSVGAVDLKTLATDFNNYYTPNAKDKVYGNIRELIADLDNTAINTKNAKYFLKSGDTVEPKSFNLFLQWIHYRNYPIDSIRRDAALGETYKNFINTHIITITKEGFSSSPSSPSPSSPPSSSSPPSPSFIDKITQWFRRLFAAKKLEPLSDYDGDVLLRFRIKDFDSELKTVEELFRKAGVSDLNESLTFWENMITVIALLNASGIEYVNFAEFVDLMNTFGATTAVQWVAVLNQLKDLRLSGYTVLTEFITRLNGFGVSYGPKFDNFLLHINLFRAELHNGLDPLNIFITDLLNSGLSYKTDESESKVNNIIQYFVYCGYSLQTYSEIASETASDTDSSNKYASAANGIYDKCLKSYQLNGPTPPPPPSGLPHILITAMITYDKLTPQYKNNLYDLYQPYSSTIKTIQYCDSHEVLKQAYLMSSTSAKYTDGTANLFANNRKEIVAFLYKEELDAFISDTNGNRYSDESKRVKLMLDISKSMRKYATILQYAEETVYTYNTIANTIQAFPILTFQYLFNDIASMCAKNPNCIYQTAVDPKYTECKASTTRLDVNHRSIPPVI
jgi:hypothetical protein